jgi:hypothetical protein
METTYRDAAIALWGEAGAYAHDAYARLQPLHYPELPEQLPITMGLTAYGGCIGLTRPNWEYGPRITLFSPLFSRGLRLVDDVLTHEMLHASLFVAGQDIHHKSQAWHDAIQRLSPAVLGHDLAVTRGADRKSIRIPNPKWAEGNGQPKTLVRKVKNYDAVQHRDVAGWPHAFRPLDYDWGEPMRCPTY